MKQLLTTLTILFLMASPVKASWLSELIDDATAGMGTSSFESQKRGYYSMGSVSYKIPLRRDPLITVSPPSYEIGCGGIDVFLGGIGFMKADYLVEKVKRSLKAAPFVAFDLGLKALCSECSEVMKTIEQIANTLNSLDFDECAAAKTVVTASIDSIDSVSKNGLNVGQTVESMASNVSSGIGSFFEDIKPKSKGEQDKLKDDAVKKLPESIAKRWLQEGGSLLDLSADHAKIKQDLVKGVRAYFGDVYYSVDNKVFIEVKPCIELKSVNISSMIREPSIYRTAKSEIDASSVDSCKKDKEPYIIATDSMDDISSKLSGSTALSPKTIDFINKTSIPVLTILKNSYTSGDAYGNTIKNQIMPVVAADLIYNPISQMSEAVLLSLADIKTIQSSNPAYGESNINLLNFEKNVLQTYDKFRNAYFAEIRLHNSVISLMMSLKKDDEDKNPQRYAYKEIIMIQVEVYGESEYVVQAFKTVAAVFSFSDFNVLTGIFITIGLFIALLQFIFSGRNNVKVFAMYISCTMILFTAFTVPKTKVLVHDKVKNRDFEVQKVPLGLAVIAMIFNDIENGLREVMSLAAGPLDDPLVVGKGDGVEILADLDQIPLLVNNIDRNVYQSVVTYMNECVSLAIGVENINVNDLSTTKNLWATLKTQTMAAFTTIYSPNGTNKVVTCKEAYTTLTGELKGAVGVASMAFCESKGYDPRTGRHKCTNDINTLIESYVAPRNSSLDATTMLMNIVAADAYIYATARAAGLNPHDYGAQQAFAKTVGGQYQASLAANSWLPAMIGLFRGILLSLFPMITLFIWISPRKAITWYLGGFIMLLLWNVIDTLLLAYYMSSLEKLFANIQHSGLGVNQLLAMPGKSMQILTQYGSARWGGMGLASAMTVGILGISGHALSSITQSSAGAADANARGEGSKFSGIGGQEAGFKEGLEAQTGMNEVKGLREIPQLPNWRAASRVQNAATEAMTSQKLNQEFGSDTAAAGQLSDNRLYNTQQESAKVDAMTNMLGSTAAYQSGETSAVNEATAIATADKNIESAGGADEYIENMARANNWDYQETMQVKDMLSNHFGSDEAAIGAMSELRGKGSMLSSAEMKGVLGAYGDDLNALTSDKERLAAFNHMSALGNFDANEMHRNAMGISTRDYVTAAANKFTLDNNMAATMNDKYNTDAFEAEQMLSFSVGENGMTNMIATRASVDGTTKSGHLLEGATETVMIGSDGRVLQKTYDGTINDEWGQLKVNGDGQTVFYSGQSGSNRTYNKDVVNTNIGKTTNVGQDDVQGILNGDASVVSKFGLFANDDKTGAYDANTQSKLLMDIGNATQSYITDHSTRGQSFQITLGAGMYGSSMGFTGNSSETKTFNNIQDAYKQIHENISGMDISREQKEELFAAEANKIMTAFKSPTIGKADEELTEEEKTALNNSNVVIRLLG